MSPMPQKNRSNSGSGNTMIWPKKLRWTATELRQRGPLIGPTARKAECARPRRVRLCLETNTYRQISENSEAKNRWSLPQSLIRLAVAVVMVGVVAALSITAAHAQAGSTNAPTSILDEYKSLEGQWVSKLLGAA